MHMHHIRRGAGKPLLLIHGLGGSWRSWTPILDARMHWFQHSGHFPKWDVPEETVRVILVSTG